MSTPAPNTVLIRRTQRGWSQAILAERAGISRAAVSAIESRRLVPSVVAALSLARVLECRVEDLFGSAAANSEATWAIAPPRLPWRYWQAEVGGRLLLYPVERTGPFSMPHDGVRDLTGPAEPALKSAKDTLVVACCDPAAGIFAAEFQRRTGYRLLVMMRSGQQALDLLEAGLIHVAGLHFSTTEHKNENEQRARKSLGKGFILIRASVWQEGIAVSAGVGCRTVRGLLNARVRWVGRESGSGARQCLDELLGSTSRPRLIADNHRGVADAVRSGWADAGVCVRLVSEEAALRFLALREEAYELCFPASMEGDPRIEALIASLGSLWYRNLLSELPGYDARNAGEARKVAGG